MSIVGEEAKFNCIITFCRRVDCGDNFIGNEVFVKRLLRNALVEKHSRSSYRLSYRLGKRSSHNIMQ